MRFIALPLAVMALGACSSPAPEANRTDAGAINAAANAADNSANAVNYVNAIDQLGETAKQGVFFRAIRDAGMPCRDVVKLEKIAPMRGVPTWRADCDQGSQHLIQVKPDGSAVVISPTQQ